MVITEGDVKLVFRTKVEQIIVNRGKHTEKEFRRVVTCEHFYHGIMVRSASVKQDSRNKDNLNLAVRLVSRKAIGDEYCKETRSRIWKRILEATGVNSDHIKIETL